MSTASDNVFDSSTSVQISAQTPALSGTVAGGYAGGVTIGFAG